MTAPRDALDREVPMTRSTPERVEILQRAPLDDGGATTQASITPPGHAARMSERPVTIGP